MPKFWITIKVEVSVEKSIKAENMQDALSIARNIAADEPTIKGAGAFGIQEVESSEVTAVIKEA